jgi:hypothetical protein
MKPRNSTGNVYVVRPDGTPDDNYIDTDTVSGIAVEWLRQNRNQTQFKGSFKEKQAQVEAWIEWNNHLKLRRCQHLYRFRHRCQCQHQYQCPHQFRCQLQYRFRHRCRCPHQCQYRCHRHQCHHCRSTHCQCLLRHRCRHPCRAVVRRQPALYRRK